MHLPSTRLASGLAPALGVSALFFGVSALVLSSPAHAATATGVVYEDRNENGVRDADEPGLPGIGVSNGRDIVKTDANGRYRVEVTDDTIVFVLKPRGWRTPFDEQQLPQFYYIHRPKGSPANFKYPGVKPTGPLPSSIDFALMKQDEPEQFHAVLFGDTQPRNQEEIDYLAHDIVEELIGSDAAFGVTLGDILYDDLSLFDSLNGTVALIGIPWYNVVGNHDINFDARNDRDSNASYESIYGPPYYSFDYGPVHFLVLDDVHWRGVVTDPDDYVGGNYIGGLGADQLTFLRKDLASIPEDQMVVLFMHIPLTEGWMEDERAQLFRLIEKRPLSLSISAHYHYHEHVFLTEADGWMGPKPHHHVINVTTCGSWWSGAPDELGIPHTTMRDGAPNGYTLLRFDGSDYALDYKVARRPADEQMHIWCPESIYHRRVQGREFFANVYNGTEKSTVEFRIAGVTDWSPMEKVVRPDPFYEEMKELEKGETPPPGRKLPGIIDSPHLWRAGLPGGLDVGHYRIEVREIDMWGREHFGERAFRIE